VRFSFSHADASNGFGASVVNDYRYINIYTTVQAYNAVWPQRAFEILVKWLTSTIFKVGQM